MSGVLDSGACGVVRRAGGIAHIDQEDAFYDAVTLAQVKAVSDKRLKSDALVIAVVKPETSR